MTSFRCALALIVLWSALVAAAPAFAQIGGVQESAEDGIAGDIAGNAEASFDLDDPNVAFRTYRLHVAEGVARVLIRVAGSESDLDLYLRHQAPMDDWGADADHLAASLSYHEQLVLDEHSTPRLSAGCYYLDVARATPGPAFNVTLRVRFDPAEVEDCPFYAGPVETLTPGRKAAFAITPDRTTSRHFRLEVPEHARRLTLATFDARHDVDLYLRFAEPITDYASSYDLCVDSVRLNERITLDRDSAPALSPGVWYIDVVSMVEEVGTVSGSLRAVFNDEEAIRPEDFRLPPYHVGESLTVMERAALACVQIACLQGEGSGTCLTPDGYILTAHHVITNLDTGEVATECFIAFPDRFDDTPVQVFEAEVIAHDEALDLALLKVTRDIYGRDLPSKLALPTVPLGDPAKLRFGEDLFVIGYPAVGSHESRSTVTITRGLASGFVRHNGAMEWLKTDARLNAGNSGGSAFTVRGELVAVPTEVIVDAEDSLGFCRPVSLIPKEWRALIQKSLPGAENNE